MMKRLFSAALALLLLASPAIAAPPSPVYTTTAPTSGLAKWTAKQTLGQATSGTDYAPATSGSSLLYGNGSGGFSAATIGSGCTFTTGTLSCAGTGTGTVTTTGSPATGNLAKFSGASSVTSGDLSGDVTTSGALATTLGSNFKIRSFGTTFGDTAGSALTSGSVVYFTVPYSCTIAAWNITVDAGTVTFDIWKIATGSAIPTVSNTITASAKPALSTGTALHSTSMSGWTTSVTANDIVGIKLDTVATAKFAELNIQCNQ